ncbi:MAG TPA: hypothetical protein VGF99_12150, partial [Myxococcota bacterium]
MCSSVALLCLLAAAVGHATVPAAAPADPVYGILAIARDVDDVESLVDSYGEDRTRIVGADVGVVEITP